MDLINLVFKSFWTFLGSVIILSILVKGVIYLIRGWSECDCERLEERIKKLEEKVSK